jgi:hypothetical protein
VILNGAGDSADINTLTLRVNKSYYHQGLRFDFWNFIQRRRLGVPAPARRDLRRRPVRRRRRARRREWIHSQDVRPSRASLNVRPGTLGTNPRIITSVKRLVDLDPGNH